MNAITKDGKVVDLSPLEGNEMFELGRKAAKNRWGQEGGALRKNGHIFRLAWFLGAEPAERMDICFTEQEVREAITQAEQENTEKREREEREARMKPTGLHFIFVNPAAPQPPRFYWGIFCSQWKIKEFCAVWFNILLFKCGHGTRWQEKFDTRAGFAVCLTEEAIRKEEAVWQPNGFTTFRVDFTLDEGENQRGTLCREEQDVVKFLAQTARNIEDDDGSDKAPDWYLHFRGQDMWQLLLKGIKAERIWRAWLQGGRKGPRVVKAQ